jgi:hypothetical protein
VRIDAFRSATMLVAAILCVAGGSTTLQTTSGREWLDAVPAAQVVGSGPVSAETAESS